jgi:hypothetical protein
MTPKQRQLLEKYGGYKPGAFADWQKEVKPQLLAEEATLKQAGDQKTVYGRYEDTQDSIRNLMNAQYTNINEIFKRREIRDQQADVARNDMIVTMRNSADATNALAAALTENQDETEFNAGGRTGGSSTGGWTTEQLEAAQGRGL